MAGSLILGWLQKGSAGNRPQRRRQAAAADSPAAPKAKRGPEGEPPGARPAKSSRGRAPAAAAAAARAVGRRNSLDVPGVPANPRPATSRAVNALRTGVLVEAVRPRRAAVGPPSDSEAEVEEEEDRPSESEDEYRPSASPALARRPPGRPLGAAPAPPADSTSEQDESEDEDPEPSEEDEDEDEPPAVPATPETLQPSRPPAAVSKRASPPPRRAPGDADSADSTASAPAAAPAKHPAAGQIRQLQPSSPPPRQISSPTIDAPTHDASAPERPGGAKGKASENAAAGSAGACSFKDRICDRLRSLCRSHEEAVVLADYVVTLTEARKDWEEELAAELKKVFKTAEQAQAFIGWVRALRATRALKAGQGGAPATGGTGAPAGGGEAADGGAPAKSAKPAKLAPSLASASKPRAAKPASTNKNDLLKSMTQQLQLILTKLNDKSITDETKEKYQTLAHSIKTQMAKITTKPQAKGAKAKGPVGRDGGLLSRAPRKIQW